VALYDQHLHSRHSFDSEADPAENVEAAVTRGLAGLTFTEHFDAHPDDWESCTYDDESYSETIRTLRSRFGSSIFIGKGIEICFQPARMDFLIDFLARHEFDLVILSVHYFGCRAVHRRSNWEGVGVEDGTRSYLETVREAASFCERLHRNSDRVFDVLGHLDLVKRYTHRYFEQNSVAAYPELIDEILEACLAADIVPEINTSTLRQGLDEPMPAATTIERYAELGGTCMSLGSDAHVSTDIGAGFDQALPLMDRAGIARLALHRERRRELIETENCVGRRSDQPPSS